MWGEPDCGGPETGGQTRADVGAYVIDISDIETDPESAELIGFIPSQQDTRPGEGKHVVEITTEFFSGDISLYEQRGVRQERQGRRITVGMLVIPAIRRSFPRTSVTRSRA
jgi:hypothetical protein